MSIDQSFCILEWGHGKDTQQIYRWHSWEGLLAESEVRVKVQKVLEILEDWVFSSKWQEM